MLFLQVQPWGTDQRWFKHGLQRLYEGGREVSVLRELLHNVMWRSAKKDVKDEEKKEMAEEKDGGDEAEPMDAA